MLEPGEDAAALEACGVCTRREAWTCWLSRSTIGCSMDIWMSGVLMASRIYASSYVCASLYT